MLSYFSKLASENSSNIDVDVLKKFDSVNIIDSSSWKVSKELKPFFPGYKGAGIKVQFSHEYLSGNTELLDITEETFNDQKYSNVLGKYILPNSLYIFDLGYSVPHLLSNIDKQKGYFVCRYSNTAHNIYIKEKDEFKKIEFLDIVKKKKVKLNEIIEINCYVGSNKEKVKVNLYAIKAPTDVSNKRRNKLITRAKKEEVNPEKQF